MTGLASFVTVEPEVLARQPAAAVQSPTEFLRVHGELFGLTDVDRQLALIHDRRDALGYSHTTFHQVHHGVPVFSGVLKVHRDPGGRVIGANGDFYPIHRRLRLTPTLTPELAIHAAADAVGVDSPVVSRNELVIVDPGWYGDPPIGEHLAFHLEISDVAGEIGEALFIDAHSGKILDRWTLLESSLHREVYNGEGLRDLPGVLARAEGEPPVTAPAEANFIYDYFQDIYDYFNRAFGRDGLDNLGIHFVATVNSRALGCPNAFWSGIALQSVFCHGTISDDVVAHEMAHGLTQFTAGLIYQNQSGQLNESFSDVFGELVDLFNGDVSLPGPPAGTPWPDTLTGNGLDLPNSPRSACSDFPDYTDGYRWLISEDSAAFGHAIRDMWDPGCRFHPDRANSPRQTCSDLDNGGVHSGSGIPNHAFAMLTDGKSFNGFDIRGIGPIKSGAVWYRALTNYLTVASDFQDAYAAFNQAALDLMGTYPPDPRTGLPSESVFTLDDAEQVDKALRAAEMNTPGRCGRTIPVLDPDPPPSCPSKTIVFRDDFEGDDSGWAVFNTQPPTPYDWVLTEEPLPFGRSGRAWYCDDPNLGDCVKVDESAVHSLLSPPITVPEHAAHLFLSFTHYIGTEPAWDGGHLRVRAGGGDWTLVPSERFLFNPPNSILRPAIYGNTNPLADQEGWTGLGGKWGASLVDLSALAAPGETLQLRFDFGKDGCTGTVGWYVDDVEVFTCADCDRNGRPELVEFRYTSSTLFAGKVGFGYPPAALRFTSPPRAKGDVALAITISSDLSRADEVLRLELNGVPLATLLEFGGHDCPLMPDLVELTVSADDFNNAVKNSDAEFTIAASELVNADQCTGGTFAKVFIDYPVSASDADLNGVLDVCENCTVTTPPHTPPPAFAKNRYLSVSAGAPGRLTAVRVTRLQEDSTSAAIKSPAYWVGPAAPVRLHQESPSDQRFARLQCEPWFRDWSTLGEVHVYSPLIVPGGRYAVQAIDLACAQGDFDSSGVIPELLAAWTPYFSESLESPTSAVWGDVADAANFPDSDGVVDFFDVASVVDRFRGIPGAIGTSRADVYPSLPDQIVDFLDISLVVDAFVGFEYPFAATPDCP